MNKKVLHLVAVTTPFVVLAQLAMLKFSTVPVYAWWLLWAGGW